MLKNSKFLAIIIILSTLITDITPKRNFFTEKELFHIEILDHSKPEERKKIFDMVFNSKNSINKKKTLLLLYKFFLDESLENIQEIKKKQKRGKFMTEAEEDILVNVHLLEKYLDTMKTGENGEYPQKLVLSLLDKETFNAFLTGNFKQILKDLNDRVFNNPFVLDAGIHHEHDEDDQILRFDL